jgi:hypothetical protein
MINTKLVPQAIGFFILIDNWGYLSGYRDMILLDNKREFKILAPVHPELCWSHK